MKGLTAKVFRTFNASITLEKELPDVSALEGLSIQEKLGLYNAANRQVAILCNHQKTVSKATEIMFENLQEKLGTMKEQREQLIGCVVSLILLVCISMPVYCIYRGIAYIYNICKHPYFASAYICAYAYAPTQVNSVTCEQCPSL